MKEGEWTKIKNWTPKIWKKNKSIYKQSMSTNNVEGKNEDGIKTKKIRMVNLHL